MFKNKPLLVLLGSALAILALVGIYNIPFVNVRLVWRIDSLRAKIMEIVNPPEEQVFVPAVEARQPTPTGGLLPTPQVTVIEQETPTPTQVLPTAPPTITPTPLPGRVDLKGSKFYVDQKNRWNYCGPANLTMALKFWGWKGDRDDVAKVVKPGFIDPNKDFISRGRLDLNVMPYEMADFVASETEYSALVRHGGDIDVIRALLAAGFPSIIEKGYYERDTQGKRTWMGHYLFVTGYDDSEKAFIVQDAYYLDGESPRKNILVKYADFIEGWRAFNYLFMVVYPRERENEVYNTLGPWGDPGWAHTRSLETANSEVNSLQGIDLFFAWFNKGTGHVQLLQYNEAASAYDRAFTIYAGLGTDNNVRPYRMVWYQTGPYWAYFYTGRYQDVVNLANVTLSTPSTGPTLEESLYWRAMAEFALGDSAAAFADMRETVRLNPSFSPGLAKLQEWGVKP
jgi:tetratricopeptide (TPR) repeat protein